MEQKKLDTLISEFLSESLSPEERTTLFDEINRNPESKKQYIAQVQCWLHTSDHQRTEPAEGTAGSFRKIQKGIRRTRQKVAFFYTSCIAIGAAILILIFGLGYYAGEGWPPVKPTTSTATIIADTQHDTLSVSPEYTEIFVPRGSRTNLVMPDGSKIWINADSKVSYSTQYAQTNRDIYLEGEAFFEVAKDNSNLFRVLSGDLCISATGTAFNVDAYSTNIKTTLLEGSVDVSLKEGKSYKLKPNQTIVFDDLQSDFNIVNRVKTELYTSWKDERWIIRDMNLEEFAQKLEKRYNVTILFSDESIKQYKISATLTTETIEQILQALRSSMHLNYSIHKNTITIYS